MIAIEWSHFQNAAYWGMFFMAVPWIAGMVAVSLGVVMGMIRK